MRFTRFLYPSLVGLAGGATIIAICVGFAPEQQDSPKHAGSFQKTTIKLDHDRFVKAMSRAGTMDDEELLASLQELAGQLRQIEQWASFMHGYELELHKDQVDAYNEWSNYSKGAVSHLFITTNMLRLQVEKRLSERSLNRGLATSDYAEAVATVDRLEELRTALAKEIMSKRFELEATDILLEAWH